MSRSRREGGLRSSAFESDRRTGDLDPCIRQSQAERIVRARAIECDDTGGNIELVRTGIRDRGAGADAAGAIS